MVWLNTKPAVAASRIGAIPGTAERSSRVWAVMSKTRGVGSALSPPGHHDDVATDPSRCVRGASGASPGPTTASAVTRSEEHTSELQSLMRISYAVFCLKKKKH